MAKVGWKEEVMARAKRTGSVYQINDGRWRASAEIPRKPGEPRKRKTFTAKTREEAERRLTDYMGENPSLPPRTTPRHLDRANAPGHHTDTQWWALVRSVQRVCAYCGIETNPYAEFRHAENAIQRDHKVPLIRGGSDDIENIAVACRSCNREKGTMTAEEYTEWKAQTDGTR